MKKIFITALLIGMISTISNAQQSLFSLNYAVSIPTGNTNDFIDQVSGRGFNAEYQKFINRNFAVGGELGYTTFYKRELNKVYNEGSAALSGIQYRYQYSYPILLTGAYYPTVEGIVKPFGGLGIGTYAQQRKIDMGIFTSNKTYWQFALRPELGILIEPAPNTAFKLSAKYNQSFAGNGLEGQSNLSFNLGLVFIY